MYGFVLPITQFEILSNWWPFETQEFSKCRKIDSLCYFQFSGIVVTEKGHLYKREEKPEMLISKAAPFLVLTSLVAILVPQRGTPTWRTHTVSCNFLKIVFSITFF